jgi:phosphotriesterase-related protein
MVTVETVRGPVDVAELGMTLMHEHVVNVNAEINRDQPGMSIAGNRAAIKADVIAELRRIVAAGITTFVDVTAVGHGRDVEFVQEVNAEVDIHIIAATGLYTYSDLPKMFHFRPPTEAKPRDAMTELFVRDIRDGIAGTGIKAAIIKVATDRQGVTPGIERALRAAAVAHRETGVPLTTHTVVAERNGLDQQRIFAEEGVDLSRVIIGHSGDSLDLCYLREIMDQGSLIGADRFGLYLPGRLNLAERVGIVADLCELGYSDRIVLAHDKTIYSDWWEPGEGPAIGLDQWVHTHISADVLPALRKRGVTEEQIQQMMVGNPRRVFSTQGSY